MLAETACYGAYRWCSTSLAGGVDVGHPQREAGRVGRELVGLDGFDQLEPSWRLADVGPVDQSTS
jgi:hypothetical protein